MIWLVSPPPTPPRERLPSGVSISDVDIFQVKSRAMMVTAIGLPRWKKTQADPRMVRLRLKREAAKGGGVPTVRHAATGQVTL